MKTRSVKVQFLIIVAFALSACGPGQLLGPTLTPTSTPTLTPTSTPTLTPTVPLVQVQDIQTLCLVVELSYPGVNIEHSGHSWYIADQIQHTLTELGLQIVAEKEPCDAILTVALTAKALGAHYAGAPKGECYAGAEVSGQMTLTSPARAPLTAPVAWQKPPTEGVIFSCPSEDEALVEAFVGYASWPDEVILDSLTHLWPPIQVLIQALKDLSITHISTIVGRCGKLISNQDQVGGI